MAAVAHFRAINCGLHTTRAALDSAWAGWLCRRVQHRHRDAAHRLQAAHSADAGPVAAVAPTDSDQQNIHQQEASASRETYDYAAKWWPVAFTSDLDRDVPSRFTLLDKPLVIWWDPAGSGGWRVFLDACPHRLVPLSEGRVNASGHLECPYHGWEFSGDGTCQRIPQGSPGVPAPPRACAVAFPCAVRQGLLFVRLKPAGGPGAGGPADESQIPVVEELEDPEWVTQDTFRDVPYDWSTLMENVLDASHVPFTHHKSISNRAVIGDYVTKITEPVTKDGFAGVWPTGPRAGALGPQYGLYRAPGYMQQKIDMVKSRGAESMVIVYAVPSSPGKCRLINRNAFKFVKSKLPGLIMRAVPGWLIHLGTQVPLEDDQIFLHYGEETYVRARAKGLSIGKAYYMPTQADTYVASFRRWLDDYGNGGPWGPIDESYVGRLEPRLPREALLDRYSGHTQSCAQCRRALKNIRFARRALSAAAAALGAAALLAASVAVCLVAVYGGGGAAGSGAAGRVAAATLGAAGWIAGAGVGAQEAAAAAAPAAAAAAAGASAAALRALWSGLASLLVWRVSDGVLGGLEEKLLRGDYPPPRNTDKS